MCGVYISLMHVCYTSLGVERCVQQQLRVQIFYLVVAFNVPILLGMTELINMFIDSE